MLGLGVNIDHVATVRQARRTVEPDPLWAAAEAELGGADGITFHLRKDRRHMGDRDAELLARTVRCKLNMEMSLDAEIVEIARRLRPTQATLVPENRREITTEGGLDAVAHLDRLRDVTAALHEQGVEVSAFVDPVGEQIRASKQAGCDAIELHTGTYANAWLLPGAEGRAEKVDAALAEICQGIRAGRDEGLVVHAGHGLTYDNVEAVAALAGLSELNIGHSIVSRALFVGLREAVAEMKRRMDRAASASK